MIESISGREFSVNPEGQDVEVKEVTPGEFWATYLSPSEAREMAMELITAAHAAEEAI